LRKRSRRIRFTSHSNHSTHGHACTDTQTTHGAEAENPQKTRKRDRVTITKGHLCIRKRNDAAQKRRIVPFHATTGAATAVLTPLETSQGYMLWVLKCACPLFTPLALMCRARGLPVATRPIWYCCWACWFGAVMGVAPPCTNGTDKDANTDQSEEC